MLCDRRFEGAVAIDSASVFERCSFTGCNLQAADLSWCRFVECRFDACNLSVARPVHAAFQNVSFVDSKLAGIDWTVVRRLSAVVFERCVLDQCAFLAMDLRGCVFRGGRLRDVVFADANLGAVDLRDTDLSGALFSGTHLSKADLRGARGYSIDPVKNHLKGMRVSMPEAAALVVALGVDVEW